jgi:hypothetical protein
MESALSNSVFRLPGAEPANSGPHGISNCRRRIFGVTPRASSDPDARIAKMKDGTTHLAHKAEHAVDMESGAVIAVTLQAADQGDTATIKETLAETAGNLAHLIEREAEKAPDANPQVSLNALSEVVADKGYHSNDTVWAVQEAQAAELPPGAEATTAQVGGQGGRAEGGVRQPAKGQRQLRKTTAEEARGIDREVIRALL